MKILRKGKFNFHLSKGQILGTYLLYFIRKKKTKRREGAVEIMEERWEPANNQ